MLSAQIDDYDVGEVIGVGTVGTIYSAIRRSSGERFAIKKLHPGICQDPLIRARFKRETVIMERLHHPNIVRSYGGGNDNGQLFYVMEFVDGGTVKNLLQTKGAFRWPIVVEIARQVCSALQFAHNHGVIHRDLKPGNLFLTREAEVKLGDFGIARDLRGSDITISGMTVGTHAYMRPSRSPAMRPSRARPICIRSAAACSKCWWGGPRSKGTILPSCSSSIFVPSPPMSATTCPIARWSSTPSSINC